MADSAACGRIDLLLTELKLPTVRKVYQRVAKEVAHAGGNFVAFLEAIVNEEVNERRARRIERRIKEARFRQVKLLSELDPHALPKGITMQRLQELAQGAYLKERGNILAVGSNGTGKTHVCIGIAVEACRQDKRVRFFTATELASELEAAQEEHQLHRYLKRFATHDLIVVDELGYVPISTQGAELLFQAFSERHERGSLIVNTNLPFAEWAQVFKTERLAVALLDRLTHKAHVLEMNGESYRLRSALTRRGKGKGGDPQTS